MAENRDPASTNVSVPAIERKDLRALLERYGVLTAFVAGQLHCKSCGRVLDDSNMGALLVRAGLLVPFCSSSECIDEAMREQGT